MNIYPMVQALESVHMAISMTPEKDERARLEEAAERLADSLRRRGVFVGTGTEPSRVLCATHPDVDYRHAWGCPDCVRELRERNAKLTAACELVLLYHSASPWDDEKRMVWANGLTLILGPAAGRDPKVVGANGDGTWDGTEPTNEATTKNLCNAVRAALKT